MPSAVSDGVCLPALTSVFAFVDEGDQPLDRGSSARGRAVSPAASDSTINSRPVRTLALQEGEQRSERTAHAIHPPCLLVVTVEHVATGAGEALVEGLEEALFAV